MTPCDLSPLAGVDHGRRFWSSRIDPSPVGNTSYKSIKQHGLPNRQLNAHDQAMNEAALRSQKPLLRGSTGEVGRANSFCADALARQNISRRRPSDRTPRSLREVCDLLGHLPMPHARQDLARGGLTVRAADAPLHHRLLARALCARVARPKLTTSLQGKLAMPHRCRRRALQRCWVQPRRVIASLLTHPAL